jgi:PKD repeat protein
MAAVTTPRGEHAPVVVAVAVIGGLVSGVVVAATLYHGDDDPASGPALLQTPSGLSWAPGADGPTSTDDRSLLGSDDPIGAVEPVTGCRVIDSPGRYELQRDIREARESACIDIQSSDVVFDGNGHTIDAVQIRRFTPIGIDVSPPLGSNATISNVTVENVVITQFTGSAVRFFETDDGLVRDVTIRDGTLGVFVADVTARNVHVSNPAEPDAFGVRVLDATVTLRDVSVADNRFGYLFRWSGGHTLDNVSAVDTNEVAFRFDEAGGNTLEDVSVVDSRGRGFEFVDSGDNTLDDISVSNTSTEGISFERSGSNTLTDVVVDDAGETGVVFFDDSGGNTLEDVFTTDTASEGLLFADSGRNTLTDVSVVDADRNGMAFIRLDTRDGSPANTLVDVEITAARLRGLVLSHADETSLADVAVADSGTGLFVTESDDVVIEDLRVEETRVEEAVLIAASEDTTIRDARLDGGAFVGLHVVESSAVRVEQLAVEWTDRGVVLSNADDVTLRGVGVTDTGGTGIEVNASTDVSIRDATVLRSDRWDVSVTSSTDDVAVRALTTESATLSFVGRDAAVASVEPPPAGPTSSGRVGVGAAIETATTTTTGSLDLAIAYGDADVSAVDESSLRLWRFAESTWAPIPGSTVDTATDEVSATVTDAGVVAPLGVEANDPPTAEFTVSTSAPEAGGVVQFDATDSTDPDGVVRSYGWDFDGDDQIDTTSASPRVSHTYTGAGTFTVSLTVTDAEGVTDTTTRTVVVSPPADANDGGRGDENAPPTGTPSPTATDDAVTEPADTPATPPATPAGVPFVWWLLLALLTALAVASVARLRQ